jgi:hypothetical protein
MKRIFLVLAVAALMAMMLTVMAMPAFASSPLGVKHASCTEQPDYGSVNKPIKEFGKCPVPSL